MCDSTRRLTRRRALASATAVLATPVVGEAHTRQAGDDSRVAWTFETGASPPHPTAAGGRVLIADASGTVHALEEASGDRVWQTSPGGQVSPFGLDLTGSRAAVGTEHGTLAVYDASDGRSMWSASTNGGVAAVTQVNDGVLVTEAGGSVALFGPDGQLRHRFDVPVVSEGQMGVPGGVSVPAYDGGRIYVQNTSAVHAFSISDATERWSTDLNASHAGKRPVFPTDETVVVTANDRVSSLARADGSIRWEGSVGGRTVNSPVTSGDVVISGDYSTQALLPADAQIEWEVDTDPYWSEGLALTPDGTTLYVAAITGSNLSLRALSTTDGTTLWDQVLGTSDGFDNYLTRPSVGRNHVLIAIEDREQLVAVRRAGTTTQQPGNGGGGGNGDGGGGGNGGNDEPVSSPGFGLATGLAGVLLAGWRLARQHR